MRVARFSLVVVLCLIGAGLPGTPVHAGDDAAALGVSALVPIRNARVPMTGVLSGGQPTIEQVELAATAGFRTVINLRTARESGFEWESELVESLGMRYVLIPVKAPKGMNQQTVKRLDDALEQALEDGPVLLHCGSGNRIGVMFALRAAWLDDATPEDALAYGLANGLTSLEGPTRELLGLAEPTAEGAPRE